MSRRAAAAWAVLLALVSAATAGPPEPTIVPLVRVADLAIGESQEVELSDGSKATVKLLAVDETTDPIRGAIRTAGVQVEVNGQPIRLAAGNYELPKTVADVKIDCPVTGGYRANASPNAWGLETDARLRLWPAGSPLVAPGTFGYPVRQRWFATATQMANEPCYVNACETPGARQIYYHYGLDFGGAEGMVEVVAATDGLVVSSGTDCLPGYEEAPVKPRYDVVYVLDRRGWYYRYSHLFEIAEGIRPGAEVRLGQRVGLLGKEGGSGGWTHLHFDVSSMQPSGKWGTQEAYAFAWEAYQREHRPELIAVARPHHVAFAGDKVTLDGTRSWSSAGKIDRYRWTFTDGATADGPTVERTYARPGYYSEVLEVRDAAGRVDCDFAIVYVIDREKPEPIPPAIHAAYYPTFGIKPGDEVTFKVRTFGTTDGQETWDFGDGSPAAATKSDGCVQKLNRDGYAILAHRYEKPGRYLVRVQRTDAQGRPAIAHLQVRVDGPPEDVAAEKPRADRPRPEVTISNETTVLTGPLRKDGYVDYVAALNQEASEGVTPENNAAVLFCRAFGPGEINEEIREPFFRMLGIEPLPEEGEYMVSSGDYGTSLVEEQTVAGKGDGAKLREEFQRAYDKAMARPWTAKESPDIAGWIKANEGPLLLVIEGTRRPRYYTPMLDASDEGDAAMVISVLLPILQELREAARLLKARAMLGIGEGKPDAAWQDLMACHRLARLTGQDPTLIGSLVGIAIDGIATNGDAWLIARGRLKPEAAARMLADLRRLPPMPPIADKIDKAERYMYLDSVSAVAGGRTSLEELAAGPSEDSALGKVMKAASGILIDWDAVLKIGNTWYDRLVASAREANPAQRKAALDSLQSDLKKKQEELTDAKGLALSLLEGQSPRQAVSQGMGCVFVTLLLPAVTAVVEAEERDHSMARLDEAAFVLAAYRARHGGFPESLADLGDEEAGRLPTDLFSGEPFRYKREGEGFLIYSLGPNGRDDGGKVSFLDRAKAGKGEDASQWDDYRLRVPPEAD
jgi:hypothetical protein